MSDFYTIELIMNIAKYKDNIIRFTKKRSVRHGVPFVLFVVGGSFIFREIADVKFKYRNVESFRETAGHKGLELRKLDEITIEAVHEKLQEIDLDNWENVRIERPWEETDGK